MGQCGSRQDENAPADGTAIALDVMPQWLRVDRVGNFDVVNNFDQGVVTVNILLLVEGSHGDAEVIGGEEVLTETINFAQDIYVHFAPTFPTA